MASGNLSLTQKKIVDDCVRHVIRLSVIVSIVISVCLFFAFGRYVSLSYLSGSLVSLLNFLLLRYQTEFLVTNPNSRNLLSVILFGYLFRFGLMGLFLFFVGNYGIKYLLSAGFGLMSVRIGIFFYGFLSFE